MVEFQNPMSEDEDSDDDFHEIKQESPVDSSDFSKIYEEALSYLNEQAVQLEEHEDYTEAMGYNLYQPQTQEYRKRLQSVNIEPAHEQYRDKQGPNNFITFPDNDRLPFIEEDVSGSKLYTFHSRNDDEVIL